MSGIFSQLGQLFVQSAPTVIFVFILLIILSRIFFKPIIAVLKKREEMTAGAMDRAKAQAEQADAKAQEYQSAFQAARQEVYRQREADRQAALKLRESALQDARQESEEWIQEAQRGLSSQVEIAKKELAAASRVTAQEIVLAVLGERTSGPEGAKP